MKFPISKGRANTIVSELLNQDEFVGTFSLATNEIYDLAFQSVAVDPDDIESGRLSLITVFSSPIENQKKAIAYAILVASREDDDKLCVDALKFLDFICYAVANQYIVEKNDNLSVYFSEIAAEFSMGHEAPGLMGDHYSTSSVGLGIVEPDLEKAAYFYELSAGRGSAYSRERLESLRSSLAAGAQGGAGVSLGQESVEAAVSAGAASAVEVSNDASLGVRSPSEGAAVIAVPSALEGFVSVEAEGSADLGPSSAASVGVVVDLGREGSVSEESAIGADSELKDDQSLSKGGDEVRAVSDAKKDSSGRKRGIFNRFRLGSSRVAVAANDDPLRLEGVAAGGFASAEVTTRVDPSASEGFVSMEAGAPADLGLSSTERGVEVGSGGKSGAAEGCVGEEGGVRDESDDFLEFLQRMNIGSSPSLEGAANREDEVSPTDRIAKILSRRAATAKAATAGATTYGEPAKLEDVGVLARKKRSQPRAYELPEATPPGFIPDNEPGPSMPPKSKSSAPKVLVPWTGKGDKTRPATNTAASGSAAPVVAIAREATTHG